MLAKYTVERVPYGHGYYVANNVARCISAGPYHTRHEAEDALAARVASNTRLDTTQNS